MGYDRRNISTKVLRAQLRVEPEQRDTHDSPRLRTKKNGSFSKRRKKRL